jgi:LmbE family N-acetylglucosaminyl deacetylase
MNADAPLRLLVLGAHPDDAEFHAGGLIVRYRQAGHAVKIISLTNGQAGYFDTSRSAEQMVAIRRTEAAAAGVVIGAEYLTWDIPDGELQPTLEVREQVIREIRTFHPDLVLTHRPNDYHPDHRAVGQLVQDASYMVRVPRVASDVPALDQDPVVAAMNDRFSVPSPLRADVVLDTSEEVATVIAMLSCHRSQVFEWLPHVEGLLDGMPKEEAEQLVWLADWYRDRTTWRADRFREQLMSQFGSDRGNAVAHCEAYEISEYARQPDAELLARLFPSSTN